jgi:O-methyltransferase
MNPIVKFKNFAIRPLRVLTRKILGTSLFGPPVSCLVPENLYAYLDAVYKKRKLNGTILEVGCALGATAAIAYTFLARQGLHKDYTCIDTFQGFVPAHLEVDRRLGLPPENESKFSDLSKDMVQTALKSWGISQIRLIEGDIASMDESLIPDEISVCLIDVDLKVPVYRGLQRVYPNLQNGGVILVDDCTLGTSWVGALEGYRQFISEQGLNEKYFMGFGVVESNPHLEPLNWPMSSHPPRETHYLYRASNPIVLDKR